MRKGIIICLSVLLIGLLMLCGGYLINRSEKQPEAEDIDYYYGRKGTASLCTRYAVYRYNDKYIFVAHYFDCGKAFMETYPLSGEQENGFKEAIGRCKPDKETDDNDKRDGAYREKDYIYVGEKQYPVKGIDWEKAGITLKDVSYIYFPEDISTEKAAFTQEKWSMLRDAYYKSKQAILFSDIDEFEKMVYDQLVKLAGEHIASVDIPDCERQKECIAEGTSEDFVIEFVTESGKNYRAVVTHMGFVDKIE